MAIVYPKPYSVIYVCDEPIIDMFKAQFREALVQEERDTNIGYT